MKRSITAHGGTLVQRVAAFILAMTLSSMVHAAPGAHGPNGEHLDGAPSASATAGVSATPRLEASSEDFELVATLGGGELSILVDRFATNEPVLNGRVEVESRGLKAVARFHADHADYAIDDAKLLEALAKPGQHPLVFTLTAGEESDLLEGVLVVKQPVDMSGGHSHDHAPGGGHAEDASHGHDHATQTWKKPAAIVAGVTALAIAAWLISRRRRNRLAALHSHSASKEG